MLSSNIITKIAHKRDLSSSNHPSNILISSNSQKVNNKIKNRLQQQQQSVDNSQNSIDQLQYGIVIDCGSSGTRIYAYKWRRRHGFEDVSAEHVFEKHGEKFVIKKVEPGISSLSPSEAVQQLEELLVYASAHIPEISHSDTILYILATAGLRMIPIETRTQLLRTIRREIPRKFIFKLEEVSVISGQDEGLFAWLSINSIMGRLCSPNTNPVAIMDMGGGSIQVAIPLLDEKETSKNLHISTADIQTIDLSCGARHKIFIHTWLGYGANKARERYEEFILKDEKYDPCLPSGIEYNERVGSDGNFESCRHKIAGANIFSTSKTRVLESGNHTIVTEEQMEEEINSLLSCLNENSDIACTYPLKADEQLPKIDLEKIELVGISEFYYTTEDTFLMSGKFNTENFHQTAMQWCQSPKNTIYSKWRAGAYHETDEYRIKIQCFKAAWVSVMLHEGLGFDIFSKKFSLNTLDNIDGKSLQWTLGALLYKSGLAGFDRPHPRAPQLVAAAADEVEPGMRFIDEDSSSFYGEYHPFSLGDTTFYGVVMLVICMVLVLLYLNSRSKSGSVRRI